jgi:hypothetical protein
MGNIPAFTPNPINIAKAMPRSMAPYPAAVWLLITPPGLKVSVFPYLSIKYNPKSAR